MASCRGHACRLCFFDASGLVSLRSSGGRLGRGYSYGVQG